MNRGVKTFLTLLLPIAFISLLVIFFSDELNEGEKSEESYSLKHNTSVDSEQPEAIKAFLRVEGMNKNIFEGEVSLPAADEPVALDKLTAALNKEGITFQTREINGNIVITSIDGEGLETSDNHGWLFMVNNEMAPAGVAEYPVKENDELIFYYGDPR